MPDAYMVSGTAFRRDQRLSDALNDCCENTSSSAMQA